jgi:hypothetical protein
VSIYRIDVWEMKRGRRDEFRDVLTDALAVNRSMGASNTSLVNMNVSGVSALRYYTATEWESFAAYGKNFADRAGESSEFQAALQRIASPDGPVASHEGALLIAEVEFVGPRTRLVPGMFSIVRVLELKPGRLSDLVNLSKEARPFVEQHHGGGTFLYRCIAGGPYTGTIYAVTAFPSMEALGGYMDTLASDPEAQQRVARLAAPDSPVIQHGVRVDSIVA